MKRVRWPIIFAVAAVSTAYAQSLRSDDFALRLPVNTEGDGLHVLELPEAVFRSAQTRTLADMRIFNAQGEVLPTAFLPAPPVAARTAAAVGLRLVPLPSSVEARESLLRMYALRVERYGDRAVVELGPSAPNAAGVPVTPGVGAYLLDARPLKKMRGRLLLGFDPDAPDYAGRIEFFGSEDMVNWRPFTAGPLARNRKFGEVIERNTFDLDRPPSFVRLSWTSKEAPMIGSAQFSEQLAPIVNMPRAVLASSLSEDRRTLYVDVPEALPIERVYVRMPEMNRIVRAQVYRHDGPASPRHRRSPLGPRRTDETWLPMGSIEAFRMVRDGAEIEGAPLPITSQTDRLRFDLAGPLEGAVPTIEAEWRRTRLIFSALAPAPYVLAAGRRDLAPGPSLDTRSVLAADDPAGTRLPTATVGEPATTIVAASRAGTATQSLWARYLLWGLLASAVTGLAWMAWRLLLQIRKSDAAVGS
ncbi:MAG: DUF3999 family protein, partial [Burkholderiaceae bacterium]